MKTIRGILVFLWIVIAFSVMGLSMYLTEVSYLQEAAVQDYLVREMIITEEEYQLKKELMVPQYFRDMLDAIGLFVTVSSIILGYSLFLTSTPKSEKRITRDPYYELRAKKRGLVSNRVKNRRSRRNLPARK